MHLQKVSTQLILRSLRRLASAETLFCFCEFSAYASSVYKRVLGQADEDEVAQSPNATSSIYFLRNSRHTDISYDASCI